MDQEPQNFPKTGLASRLGPFWGCYALDLGLNQAKSLA